MHGPPCELCQKPIESGGIRTAGGYRHETCPKRGPSTGLIVAGLGCAGLGGFVILILVFLAIWQFLSPTPPVAAFDGGPAEPFSQSFATQNGLATVHYPPEFAASTPSEHALVVQRRVGLGTHYVTVDAVDKPVSEHLEEVDRLVRLELAKTLPDFVATPPKPSTCHGEPGVASGGSYPDGGQTYELRACSFMKHGTYHRCAYAAPRGDFLVAEPQLQEICERVEIRAPADK